MKQLAEYIVGIIDENLKSESAKRIIRIEGFEDIRIYHHICERTSQLAEQGGFDLVAKLSGRKFLQLRDADEYDIEAGEMLDHDWVDLDDHMTSYRNLIPKRGQKLVVLMMGTDAVEDKGGLEDFFAITPQFLDHRIGNHYSQLISQDLRRCIDVQDDNELDCVVDAFFTSLFHCVPKDIAKVSSNMDRWESSHPTLREAVKQLYETLPEWGIPKIVDEAEKMTLTKLKNPRSQIMIKANGFLESNAGKKPTDRNGEKLLEKFQKYAEKHEKYADYWPEGQGTTNLSDLRDTAYQFIMGDHSVKITEKLLNTDFTILNDVLRIKLDRPSVSKEMINLHGMPLSVLLEALFLTMFATDIGTVEFNAACFRLKSAQVAGIPPKTELKEQTGKPDELREALISAAWKRLGYFAGGIFEFLQSNGWEYPQGEPIEIYSEPDEFFCPDNSDILLKEGFLTAKANASAHVIEFSVELSDNERVIKVQKFKWTIDPQEDWVLTFKDFDSMPKVDGPYIPIGYLPEMNVAYTLPDDDAFRIWYDTVHPSFLDQDKNPVDSIRGEIRKIFRRGSGKRKSDKGPLLEAGILELGTAFQAFRTEVMQSGFFYSLYSNTAIVDLINQYVSFIDIFQRSLPEISESTGDESLMRMVSLLFSIVEDEKVACVNGNAGQMIIPPYHPAALEKIATRMEFISMGVRQNFGKNYMAQINKMQDLSELYGALDAVPLEMELVGCKAQYGYYSLYGEVKKAGKLTSSDVIAQSEMIFTDDFQDRRLKNRTRESVMVQRVMEQYVDAYRNGTQSLTVAFIDPQSIQTIAAAVFYFAEGLRKRKDEDIEHLSLVIDVIQKADQRGARTFLAYWANQEFSEDDVVSIKIYHRSYEEEEMIPDLIPPAADIAFYFNALHTEKGRIAFKLSYESESMEDCLFPIVFQPFSRRGDREDYVTQISQKQFCAAMAYTQLCKCMSGRNINAYDVMIRRTKVDRKHGAVIQAVQKRVIWLACMDEALDKRAVRDLYASDTGIIGFTTGEGSEGNLNLAITCREEVVEDLKKRCQRRLRGLFPGWDGEKLKKASSFCVDMARKLDGVSLMRAMNPDDCEIHNYLAYLLTRELCQGGEDELTILIRLDSYRHWMTDEKRIPDFLLLQAVPQEDELLHFTATVIEAKIARSTTLTGQHIPKAIDQVRAGRDSLAKKFDPDSDSMERRYWFAQLYRAIVFLLDDIELSEDTWDLMRDLLPELLEGEFTIDWRMRIIACEIDDDSYLQKSQLSSGEEEIELWSVGQLAMQNILLQKPVNSRDVTFDAGSVIEETAPWDEDEDEEESTADSRTDPGPDPIPDSPDAPSVPEPEPPQPVLPDTEQPKQPDIPPVQPPLPPPTYVTLPAEESGFPPLQEVRVLIGKAWRGSKPVYWEFGNPKLPARHLLITGSSGQGKTYAIQTFLFELARQGISSVVFDYTDGFLPGKLEPEFERDLGAKLKEYYAIADRLPVNPFLRQTILLPERSFPENSSVTASRFSAILKHVYKFGEQQRGALYRACRSGIEKYQDKMNFTRLWDELVRDGSSTAKTVLSKIQQIVDMDLFDTEKALDWNGITKREGKVTVFQLTNLDRETQTILTEIMLWDAWYSLEKSGSPDRPFVVVLDEAQNLSFAEGSPAQKILQEGRKFGWSAWFATQFMKGALSSDEISRLQQAPVSLNFKPSPAEAPSVAQALADQYQNGSSWENILKSMQKGVCVVKGDRILPNGSFGAATPVQVQVSSFAERTRGGSLTP